VQKWVFKAKSTPAIHLGI